MKHRSIITRGIIICLIAASIPAMASLSFFDEFTISCTLFNFKQEYFPGYGVFHSATNVFRYAWFEINHQDEHNQIYENKGGEEAVEFRKAKMAEGLRIFHRAIQDTAYVWQTYTRFREFTVMAAKRLHLGPVIKESCDEGIALLTGKKFSNLQSALLRRYMAMGDSLNTAFKNRQYGTPKYEELESRHEQLHYLLIINGVGSKELADWKWVQRRIKTDGKASVEVIVRVLRDFRSFF